MVGWPPAPSESRLIRWPLHTEQLGAPGGQSPSAGLGPTVGRLAPAPSLRCGSEARTSLSRSRGKYHHRSTPDTRRYTAATPVVTPAMTNPTPTPRK